MIWHENMALEEFEMWELDESARAAFGVPFPELHDPADIEEVRSVSELARLLELVHGTGRN